MVRLRFGYIYISDNFKKSVWILVYCSHLTFFNICCLSANCSAGVLIEKYVSNLALVIYLLEVKYFFLNQHCRQMSYMTVLFFCHKGFHC